MANIVSAAEKAAKAAEMASRVKGLARARELRTIASLNTRARVQGLARQAELDMKAKVSLANSGKAAHAGLSNTAKASRGKKFYEGQKASKIKPKGSSSVGFRDAPLPGSAAAIPRGGDVPMLDKLPGKQLSTGSSVYKKQKSRVPHKTKNKGLNKILNTEQPGSDAWLDAVVKRYPNM